MSLFKLLIFFMILNMSLFTSILDSRIVSITPPLLAHSANVSHVQESDIELGNLLSRVFLFIKSWVQEASYFVTMAFLRAEEIMKGAPCEYIVPKAENVHWKEKNKGLYVAIHGLNGHPSIWHTQLLALRKLQPEFEIRLPYVHRRGNCELQEAVMSIEAMVRDYIEHYPNNPVCLIGVSNGARIAADLEIRLRDTKTPIKVSCIAGAFFGTKQMNLLDKRGVARRAYSGLLVDELLYQSPTAVQLGERMRAPVESNVLRSYEFYATPSDFQIRPYTASFPFLNNENVYYYLVPGENHNSIVSKVADIQVKNCVKWMKNMSDCKNYRSS